MTRAKRTDWINLCLKKLIFDIVIAIDFDIAIVNYAFQPCQGCNPDRVSKTNELNPL